MELNSFDKALLLEIAYRVPAGRIVKDDVGFRVDIPRLDYSLPIFAKQVEDLVEWGYLEETIVGGVKPTTKTFNEIDLWYTKEKIANPKHPGMQMDIAVFPHELTIA